MNVKEVFILSYLSIDLMPENIKKQMIAIKNVGISAGIFAIVLLLAMWGFKIFRDLSTGVVFSLVLLSVAIPLQIPSIRFDKVAQSTVRFEFDQIKILDKKGRCWKSINYCSISAVRVEEVNGFFYGKNTDLFRNKYICIFLNNSTNIPDVPFADLYDEKDFVMLNYQIEALQLIQQKFFENGN